MAKKAMNNIDVGKQRLAENDDDSDIDINDC